MRVSRFHFVGLILFSFICLAAAPGSEEELHEAARLGDLAKVRSLVEGGVDPNAKSRYGATALSFASDKGHIQVVRYLLDKGAEINVSDSFYRATPLSWAISNDHRDVALLLLSKGADGAAQAIPYAIRKKDREIAQAAIDSGKLRPSDVRSAMERAKRANAQEILELLEAIDLPQQPTVNVAASVLKGYAGKYENTEIGMTVQVSEREGALFAQPAGQAALKLRALSQTEFEAEQRPIRLAFSGRGGTIEGFSLSQGPANYFFRRSTGGGASAEEASSTASAESDAPAEVADSASAPLTDVRGRPANWPSFRGPNASGVADGQGAPVTWSAEGSKNILWKTPLAGLANSSPIIWGDRIFVTSVESSAGDRTFRTGLYGDVKAVDDTSTHVWKLVCLDRKTGRVIWEKEAARGVPVIKRHLKSTQANPTPATDGSRVVALFPSHGLFCYDFQGNLLWKKDLGLLDSGWFYDRSYQWGFASSPIIYGDSTILQVDIQDQSYIAAFDLKTGKRIWKTDREEIPTWSTPTLFTQGQRHEVIANGTTIRGYDAKTGRELWQLGPNSEIVVATPVVGDDMIYLTSGYPPVRPVYAVRPGARGDITLEKGSSTNDSIAWSHNRGGTYMPTPILYRGYLYTNANNGVLTCYEASTGKRVYRARIGKGDSFSASPVAADGRLYFSAESGRIYVAQAGPKYSELAVNELGEPLMASPAISDGLLVVRSLKHVFGIGGE